MSSKLEAAATVLRLGITMSWRPSEHHRHRHLRHRHHRHHCHHRDRYRHRHHKAAVTVLR